MNNKTLFSVGDEPEPQMQDPLVDEANAAFEKLDCGKTKFISHEQAKSEMAERKTRIRTEGGNL